MNITTLDDSKDVLCFYDDLNLILSGCPLPGSGLCISLEVHHFSILSILSDSQIQVNSEFSQAQLNRAVAEVSFFQNQAGICGTVQICGEVRSPFNEPF